MALRRELHRRGMRFRIHVASLPGRPDIVLTRARIAVFVDGCFWHACPDHGTLPKNNRGWWREKLTANVERDGRNDRLLSEQGWLAVHLWEHTTPEEGANRVENLWLKQIGRARAAPSQRVPAS
jgi:DNA mismatch endonuclease (patch repair protein)